MYQLYTGFEMLLLKLNERLKKFTELNLIKLDRNLRSLEINVQYQIDLNNCMNSTTFEPRPEKTCHLYMRKHDEDQLSKEYLCS